MLGNIVDKSAKKDFSIRTNIVSQKWGGNAGNNFSRITRIVRPKNGRKKSSEKVRKNVFYIRTNIVPKKWGKNARNNFS